ncbi:uncharacterized protein LOC143196260 [Rhynchophorus ferrugineus]|uniref:uncharacterized protein LOC143196260 n=1 Tax=Rhynchophorus ferrugineus TaxID=354439 RepID=UPI003FCE5384
MTSLRLSHCVILWFGLAARCVVANPAIKDDHKYDEYVIEHEISYGQAKNYALNADINSIITPPGCQECTKEEKLYCNTDLINDHCCCNKRFHEYLPYIPHTCYTGTQLCVTMATDCNKYTRLRTCCCDKYLLPKWRSKYGASASSTPNTNAILAVASFLVSTMYIYL